MSKHLSIGFGLVGFGVYYTHDAGLMVCFGFGYVEVF